ncbi:TPA: DUF4038 domain-containing protein [Clostridioides difficile]
MSRLKVASDNRTFTLDKEHFFYLADTCWSAFTNIDFNDWKFYLEKRKQQGFNTLQINILPQWDRSAKHNELLPFDIKDDGAFDYSTLNKLYFENARDMCLLAKEYGFQLALVVLWSNYVPGTWASAIMDKNVIPISFLPTYFDIVNKTFNDMNPIYLISGDTDFEKEESIGYYDKALEFFNKVSPNTLKTLHIRGRLEEIPEILVSKIDFYMYQSGHNSSFTNMPYYLAEVFYSKYPCKPILNSEPCYEQMGYSRKVYGRFNDYDIRKAGWQSVLSGGCAGLTYGAHGIWSWHTNDSTFFMGIGEAFDSPLLWQSALQLPGAFDYGMIKYLLEQNNLKNIIPKNNLVVNDTDEIRYATNDDKSSVVLYIPINTNVKISENLSEYKFHLFDLETKNILIPLIEFKKDSTLFKMHSCNKDIVIIGQK